MDTVADPRHSPHHRGPKSADKTPRLLLVIEAGDYVAEGHVITPHALLRDPTLSPRAKALYGLLRSYGNEEGQECPPTDVLAADMGWKNAQRVIRTMQELLVAGWLRVLPSGPSMYVALTPRAR